MVKKVIAAVILLALLTVAVIQAVDKKEQPNQQSTAEAASAQKKDLQVGEKAPDFELKTLNGESVKLSNYKGKKVMLNFWATWCPPCKQEIPEIEQFYKQENNNIVILAVNLDPQDDVKGFAAKEGITYPVLLDSEGNVSNMYKVLAIPTTYFIDSNGVIQNKYTGAMNQDMIKQFTNGLQ